MLDGVILDLIGGKKSSEKTNVCKVRPVCLNVPGLSLRGYCRCLSVAQGGLFDVGTHLTG